jgi:hypothetical protein
MNARKFDLPDGLFEDEAMSGTKPKALDLEDWANSDARGRPKKDKQRPKTIAASVFDRTLVETRERMRTAEWEDAGARHLVALYAILHEKIYGVEAAELGPQERYTATLRAGLMLKNEFDGDIEEAVAFFRWAWQREASREKWRRENNRSGGRIGIRLMFSGQLLTDYRLDRARKRRS